MDSGIEILHDAVVEAARGLQFVFGVAELALKREEVFVGLEGRIIFRDREEGLERATECVFGGGLCIGGGGAHGGSAHLGHLGECVGLVLHVALDRLDKIGDEIVAAFELDIDIGPRFLDPHRERDEAVVREYRPKDEHREDDKEDDGCGDHME